MLLIAISCAWVLGIFLGSYYRLPLGLIFTGLVPIPLIFFFPKYRKLLVLITVSLFTFLGASFYYPTTVSPENQITQVTPQSVIEMRGIIESPPEIRDTNAHIELTIQETKIDNTWQKNQGKILIFVPRYPAYQYGDTLLVKGKLENPPEIENFDYQACMGTISGSIEPVISGLPLFM
jgi:competence protein ComEC